MYETLLSFNMSNSHPLRPYTAVGEIDHVHILSDHVGVLMNGEEYSDVTFIVEKKRFPAHRVILAARCQYFRWSITSYQLYWELLGEEDKSDSLKSNLLDISVKTILTFA